MTEVLDDLLLPSDVSKMAGISTKALEYHERRGTLLPLKRLGNRRLFSRAAVEVWLKVRAEKAAARKAAGARP